MKQHYAITGAQGTGKTTLARTLAEGLRGRGEVAETGADQFCCGGPFGFSAALRHSPSVLIVEEVMHVEDWQMLEQLAASPSVVAHAKGQHERILALPHLIVLSNNPMPGGIRRFKEIRL